MSVTVETYTGIRQDTIIFLLPYKRVLVSINTHMRDTSTRAEMTRPQLTLRDILYRRCNAYGKRVWQHEVAREAGIDQSVLSRIVSGVYPVKPEMADALCKALRCTTQELLAALPPDFSVLHNIYKRSLNQNSSSANKQSLNDARKRERPCRQARRGRK